MDEQRRRIGRWIRGSERAVRPLKDGRRRRQLIGALVLVAVFFAGVFVKSADWDSWVRSAWAVTVDRLPHPGEYVGALTEAFIHGESLDYYELHLGPKAYTQLVAQSDGHPTSDNRQHDELSAKLIHQGQLYHVRLHGDGKPVSVLSNFPPVLVLRGGKGDRPFGLKRFTIEREVDGKSLHRWCFLEFMRHAGIAAPRQRFIELRVNGSDRGVHVITEQPSQEFLEENRRREGVMLNCDSAFEANCRIVDEERVNESPLLRRQKDAAIGLLDELQAGRRAPSSVFDVELTGRYCAQTVLRAADLDVPGVAEALYFNPITERLEPMAVFRSSVDDADAGGVRRNLAEQDKTRLLADAAISRAYLKALQAGCQGSELDTLTEAIGPELLRLQRAVRRSHPLTNGLDDPWVAVAEKASAIRGEVGGGMTLSLTDRSRTGPRSQSTKTWVGRPATPSLSEFRGRHPFVEYQSDRNALRVPPGRWDVAGDLVLPDGVALECAAGSILRFEYGTILLANGPVHLLGTVDAPVVLEPRVDWWGGLVILRAGETSEWRHVEIRQSGGVARGGWILTGGVTVYRSNVSMSHVMFNGSWAEDALNIVLGNVQITDTTFTETRSDAFDGDFVTGTVERCRFERIGGDALDVSGANLDVRTLVALDIGDKAVSVGERSSIRVRDLSVNGGDIAVACKDSSTLRLERTVIRNARVGLAAFAKKDMYGPAQVTATDVEFGNVLQPQLVQTGSEVTVDGIHIPTQDVDVVALYANGPNH